jgi:exodeoxyribonuclease V alpha subunit
MLAIKLFAEREGKRLTPPPSSRWPRLENWMGRTVDIALAELLLKPYPAASETTAAFLCYLSLAVREGHLCVSVSGKTLTPDPLLLLRNLEEIDQFKTMVQEGASQLPAGLLIQEGERFYFQRYWAAEKRCLTLFQALIASEPILQVDQAQVSARLDSLLTQGLLLPEQAEAIRCACSQRLTLLCGGPGTGKTYTIGYFLRLFLESLPAGTPCEIALAAPTGKAAVHLSNSLAPHKASTLHKLLKTQDTLAADLIIVDESSMIDLKMMNRLLAAVKPGARLILVGDRHQLAPVESGTLFADLVAYHPPIELKQCLRTERQGLIHFANAIQAGKSGEVLHLLNHTEGLHFQPIEKEENSQKELLDILSTKFYVENETELLQRFNRFCLLSPLRKGPLGVDTLNRLCAARLARQPIAPIILTRSDPSQGLFNGEIAVLVQAEEPYALFSEGRRVPALLLPSYEYAYCLSVYKSQGSEFDNVLLVLPQGSELFGRELLYTAVTRARHQVQIWGSTDVISQTVTRQASRLSGIAVWAENHR